MNVSRAQPHQGSIVLRLCASEWLKLVSLRSARWIALLIVSATVGGGALFADRGAPLAFSGAAGMASILVAILAVLSMSSEYANGTMQITLLAAPRRPLVLLAKAIVTACVSVILVATGSVPVVVREGARDVGIPLLAMCAGIAAVSVLFVCIGGIVRNVPASVTAAIALTFLLPPLLGLARIGGVWLSDFTPGEALSGLIASAAPEDALQSAAVLGGWIVAAGLLSALMLQHRDA